VSLCTSGGLTKNRENAAHVQPPEQNMFRDRTEPTLFRAGTVPETVPDTLKNLGTSYQKPLLRHLCGLQFINKALAFNLLGFA